jgi:2-hydroxymuconate-semialdehyde hydrolase
MMLLHELMEFIRRDLAGEHNRIPIDEQTPLIDQGIIDSMGLMQLIDFIEARTGVRVPDDEVMPDNFETVASMGEMIARLRARQAAP